MSRNQALQVISHNVDFETSFRTRIFSLCADLASNPISIQGRRNVQRNGESHLRRKPRLFSTRVAHVARSLQLLRRAWRKDGPVCGVLHTALIRVCRSRWVVKLAAKHVSCP